MRPRHASSIAALGIALAVSALPLAGQSRILPAGTVILVKTTTALESATAQVGQTFETIVEQDVGVDAYTVIPAGSRIRGSISMARPATRAQSGVIDVHFDRLTPPNGAPIAIDGKLTSTDSAERRQINADPNAHVVLVGRRGGIGAAIAGAGGSQSSNNILSALGGLLSEGRDVSIAAGTPLAVELTRDVSLRGRGRIAGTASASASTIYTASDLVRAAQQSLTQRNYYRGTPTGTLDNATRRALFAFQIDNGLTGTGNLDGRTAQLLGLSLADTGGAAMSVTEATSLRRDAQTLLARHRVTIGIDNNGRETAGRAYSQAELEVLFALSAFADNASMYEQLVRAGQNQGAAVRAGRSLINAARRVDAAISADGSVAADVRTGWSRMRQALSSFEAANPGG
jgi:peptidoglycan hydrolase-like protein with peptidoglycan-binding domain